jgi:nitroreductase
MAAMRTELILEIIRERWSPYSFSQNPVEEFKLKAMFEAAGYAPSCNNEQPWIFVYATRHNMAIFEDYLEFLDEPDKLWAKNSYSLVVSMARKRYSESGMLNELALYDTGMAVSNLLLQACAMDVYIHQMHSFSVEKVKEYFRLDDEIQPVTIMAVGYLGDGATLPPVILKKDEEKLPRKQVNDYTFKNSFSEQAF